MACPQIGAQIATVALAWIAWEWLWVQLEESALIGSSLRHTSGVAPAFSPQSVPLPEWLHPGGHRLMGCYSRRQLQVGKTSAGKLQPLSIHSPGLKDPNGWTEYQMPSYERYLPLKDKRSL